MSVFEHNSSRNDLRLLRLRQSMGFEGMGLYWFLQEVLADNDNALKVEDLSLVCQMNGADFEKARAVLEEYALFEPDECGAWHSTMQAEPSAPAAEPETNNAINELSEKRRAAAQKRWGRGKKNAKDAFCNANSDANAYAKVDANAYAKVDANAYANLHDANPLPLKENEKKERTKERKEKENNPHPRVLRTGAHTPAGACVRVSEGATASEGTTLSTTAEGGKNEPTPNPLPPTAPAGAAHTGAALGSAALADIRPRVPGIVALYHELCPRLPKVNVTTHELAAGLCEMYAAMDRRDDLLAQTFATMNASNFCAGFGSRGWKASLSWLAASRDRWQKVLNGEFDDGPGQKAANAPNQNNMIIHGSQTEHTKF